MSEGKVCGSDSKECCKCSIHKVCEEKSMSDLRWVEIPASEKEEWLCPEDKIWRLIGREGSKPEAAVVKLEGNNRYRPMKYSYEEDILLIGYFKIDGKIADSVYNTLEEAQRFAEECIQ